MTMHKTLKTGSDPRTLPDYSRLRDELSKLTHPARPDVNWRYVEKLCLALFEQNGVELQTAAWYTLARTQLAGLTGLNEGLAILEALISHQWAALWPQPVHARLEILNGLSQRIQQQMRTLSLNPGDLSQLHHAEQLVTSLRAALQRLELKHLSQLDTLHTLLHNCAVRLANSDGASGSGAAIQSGIGLSATGRNGAGTSADAPSGRSMAEESAPSRTVKRVYVAKPQRQSSREVQVAMPAPEKKWTFFTAGMCTMLVVSTVAVWSWQYLHRPDPLQTRLAASLAPLPATLTPAQLDALRQQSPLPQAVITQTQQQLARLETLSPDWNIVYGRQLVEQAQALWPEQAKSLAAEWQQRINASALPVNAMNGWHKGMMQLQALADRLDALDGQKGKYITVSELKSQVFGMMTSFRQTTPVEEQFRLMKLLPEGSPARQQQIQLTEQHLRSQLYTWYGMNNAISNQPSETEIGN